MSYQDCIQAVQAAMGENRLSERELDDLFTAVDTRRRALRARTGMSEMDATLQAAQEIGDAVKTQSLIAKRNAAINLTKRVEKVAWIQRNFGSNFARGIEATIVGIQSAKGLTRASALQEQDALRASYVAALGHDLETAGVADVFRSGAMDHDIWIAHNALRSPDEARIHAGLPREAVTIAKIADKWQEHWRLEANAAGAWIQRANNFVTNRTHNAERISNLGRDGWKQLARETFDIPKMVGERGVDAEKMLDGLYDDLHTGDHVRVTDELVGSVGTRNIGKLLSESRSIFFKDGEASWRYNQSAGGPNRSLRGGGIFGVDWGNKQVYADALLGQASRMADATGLMRVLGPNPEEVVNSIKRDLMDAAKRARDMTGDANAKLLQDAEGKLDVYLAAVDGRANQIGSYGLARWGQNLRSWQKLSKLGMMLFSQLNDIAVHGANARYQGRGFFSGMHDMVTGQFTNLSDPERRRLAASLGVMLDNFTGETARAGSFDLPGAMSKGVQLFMKWNGSNWWNSHGRFAAAAGMSAHMAGDVGKTLDQLHPDFQRVLGQYGIGAKEWDVIRAAPLDDVHGAQYVTPENFADKKVADKFRLFINDQVNFAQLEPSRKTTALMLGGLQPGTGWGELARSVMLFKSFTAAYMEKTMGRELFGRGIEHDGRLIPDAMNALRNGQGVGWNLTNLILMSTLFGYGSLVLKDIAKGKTPRNPLESPEMGAKIFAASMVQGGGAGFYGDFLFGEVNRLGGHTLDSLAGPVLGTVAGGADWWLKVRGELEKGEVKPDVAAGVWRGIVNNTPGTNLYWSKWAMDYMLNYRVQEYLNPGHLHRVEQDMQKNDHQRFLFRPQVGFGQ